MPENLKQTWRFYALFFAGIGLLWLSRCASGALASLLAVLGGAGFFVGAVLLMRWDRKRKKEEEKEES